jgi:hypothetical protein
MAEPTAEAETAIDSLHKLAGGQRRSGLVTIVEERSMDFNKEFVVSQLEGVEKAEELAEKIYAGAAEAIAKITINRDKILSEKKNLEKEYSELKTAKESADETLADLNKKLEIGFGDKEKVLQADVEKWKNTASKYEADMKTQLAEKDKAIATMKADQHRTAVFAEFSKTLDTIPGVYPELRKDIQNTFFAENSVDAFEFIEYGGEKSCRNNKDSKTMADLLNEKMNSPEGKHYRQNLNTGGGASGGSAAPAGSSSMKREQFTALPHGKQVELANKGIQIID